MRRPPTRRRARRGRPTPSARAGAADVALAATLHDPTGALAPQIRRALPKLAALYRGIRVATSPPTAAGVRALLVVAGVHAGTPARDTRGPLYRLALRRALATGASRVHYLDFDRALHWIERRPRELAALLATARRHDALLVGRTRRAHRSHHRPLVATEDEANAAFARRLGLAGRVDFLTPSFVLHAAAVRRLCARSRARDAAIYGELPVLLAAAGARLGYVECDGLDWETPDRDPRGVRRLGLAVWRRRMETPDEWARRRVMGATFLRGAERACARVAPGRVRLVRVRLSRR